jgi:alpha-tubulin suppressor-like RCC1 family protein
VGQESCFLVTSNPYNQTMRKFLLCLLLVVVNIVTPICVANATEIQNWLYVTGNSPKETRTSVAQGNATGFGITNLQGISLGNQVALSEGSVHLLDTSGKVWGWGNEGREVGTGSATPVTQPRIIPFAEKITEIASGNNHSLALSETGKVFAWGWNGHGQIGLGANADYEASWRYSSPVQVNIPGGRLIKSISAGGYQSFAIAADNTIWAWGINENYSILGTGGYSSVFTPTLIRVPSGFLPIKLVTNGGRYTLVLGQSGNVIGWGSNGNFGAEGLGISGEIQSPTLIFSETASIIDIAVNGAATYVLNTNGIVFSAGYNGYGQLGWPNHPAGTSFAKVALPSTFKAEKIFAANSNVWAVSSSGQSYTWGAGSNDTLGTGYTGTVFTPILLSTISDYGIVDIAGNYTQTFAVVSNQAKIKAAAELKAKQEAEAKAAAELKAKQEAEANAAAELKAKQEAEAKAAAELKAKQEAEAKAAADKALAEKIIADAKLEAARIVAEAKSKASAALKKTTITCVKGKLTKKVTAVKPKCPSGYKLKK